MLDLRTSEKELSELERVCDRCVKNERIHRYSRTHSHGTPKSVVVGLASIVPALVTADARNVLLGKESGSILGLDLLREWIYSWSGSILGVDLAR